MYLGASDPTPEAAAARADFLNKLNLIKWARTPKRINSALIWLCDCLHSTWGTGLLLVWNGIGPDISVSGDYKMLDPCDYPTQRAFVYLFIKKRTEIEY